MLKRPNLNSFMFEEEVSSPAIAERLISVDDIEVNPNQPRRYFDPLKLEQLSTSIKQHSILEPLLLRSLPDGRLQLVAGERRYRAALMAGLKEVPAIVRTLSNREALQLSLIENLQREDLNPVEETEGILQLLAFELNLSVRESVTLLHRMQNETKGKVTRNVTGNSEAELVKEFFSSLGLMSWQSFVRNRLPLRQLPEEVLEVLRQGKIAYTKAVAIAKVANERQRRELLQEAIAGYLSLSEIRERIVAISQKASLPEGDGGGYERQVMVKTRVERTYRQLKRSRVWTDASKLERLEELIDRIEKLISSD